MQIRGDGWLQGHGCKTRERKKNWYTSVTGCISVHRRMAETELAIKTQKRNQCKKKNDFILISGIVLDMCIYIYIHTQNTHT